MAVGGALRAEIDDIRSRLGGSGDTASTPLGADESLRQFYARTAAYWSEEVARRWRAASATGDGSEVMGEKEVKREGFLLAETRYNELLPIMQRLTELEKQQLDEEEGATSARGGSSAVRRSRR